MVVFVIPLVIKGINFSIIFNPVIYNEASTSQTLKLQWTWLYISWESRLHVSAVNVAVTILSEHIMYSKYLKEIILFYLWFCVLLAYLNMYINDCGFTKNLNQTEIGYTDN